MSRFVCTGDLHIGAGSDLGEPGERLAEQEAVLAWIVKTANELDATLLFAGDAWERRRPTPAEVLAFRRPTTDAFRKGMIAIPGNHDVEAWQRPTGYDLLAGDGQTEVMAAPRFTAWPGIDRPEALIVSLPWAPPTHLVALEGGGDRDDLLQRLAAALVEIARAHHLKALAWRDRWGSPAMPIVLLAHWSISGATASSGAPVDLFREPILPIGALEAIGFDAIVAGHIHRPQMLGERGFYVGSPMPLNFGEAGHDHAVWLLDVEPGRFSAFQIPVPSTPLVNLDVDVSDAGGWAAISGVDGAIVKARLRLSEEQARRVDVGSLKAEILQAGARKVWAIQTEVERAEVTRGVAVDETISDLEALDLYLQAQGIDEDRLEALLERHVAYTERLRP